MTGEGRTGEPIVWRPMDAAAFGELTPGRHLCDRRGRVWSLHVGAHGRDGREVVIPRSGGLVRLVDTHYADDFLELPEDAE